MVYSNLKFPTLKTRPYFYTNFVSTVDGKIQVITNPKAYWPIGSELDSKTFLELRSYSDAIIHGRNTALRQRTVESLAKNEYKTFRRKLGKKKDILYIIITNNPDRFLANHLNNTNNIKPFIVTSKKATIAKEINAVADVIRLGKEIVNLKQLSSYLFKNNYKTIHVEAGPSLVTQFLKLNLLDELFLTVAPKIIGNDKDAARTLSEGYLFPPQEIKRLQLLSIKEIESELFLRYKVN